ncbi:hypothetical protein B0T26DRAFT_756228 [Lasiosphaeria miniovina]|uniref:Protamine P1 n=1 Tax=Lasiosphaeria miniovina TaxID=1954250 RepID=A0AA40A037_9PEZI|nr:uncharacterized protein B0T26DRAFT_756228 [Lasiosphaeria miniovina]KAK0706769.1 hypothetical protein B0T26DRAFT_756228 [Lasiosphaeria miniovina]
MKRHCLSPSRTWLLPDNFADELVYCEAVPKSADDVLYSGSEDEAYDNSDDRRARYETQAQRFLNGHEPVLLSASLRGPFGGKHGWTNPWRSTSASALHHHHVESSQILGTATSSMPPPETVRPKSPARAHRFLNNESLCRVDSWRQGITTDICTNQASSSQGASITESEDSILPGTQSARGNGTSRTLEVPISLPPVEYDLPNATDSYPTLRQASYRDEDVDMANSLPHTNQPSTPETKRSSLPTPDFTLSIKSFREFMTPSPQRPTKIRRISTADGGYLPSTQILVDAAISNPWAMPSTKKRSHNRIKKHVTWAPLPGEEGASPRDGDEVSQNSLHGAEPPYITTLGNPAPRLPRAASPPPLIVAAEIPARDEKFAKHFAAMAGRRLRTPIPRTSLLPSASQQFCASPAVDAMANAFIQADEQATDGTAAVQGDSPLLPLDLRGNTRMEEDGAQGGDRLVQDGEESDATDDVNAVLENISDFLESWDIDAELAKAARADNSRSGRDNDTPTRMPRSVLVGSSIAVDLPGLMDDGVWD